MWPASKIPVRQNHPAWHRWLSAQNKFRTREKYNFILAMHIDDNLFAIGGFCPMFDMMQTEFQN